MRLASLANFPPLNFCCYPAVPDQYLVPSCPWWEATEEAITEMKKLASEAGDKVLLGWSKDSFSPYEDLHNGGYKTRVRQDVKDKLYGTGKMN